MRQGSLGHHHFLRPTLKTGFSQKLGIHERQGLGPVIELATQKTPSIVSVISSSRSGPGWLILRYSVPRVVDVRQRGIHLFSLSIEIHNLSYRVIKPFLPPPNSRLNSTRGSACETAQILSASDHHRPLAIAPLHASSASTCKERDRYPSLAVPFL